MAPSDLPRLLERCWGDNAGGQPDSVQMLRHAMFACVSEPPQTYTFPAGAPFHAQQYGSLQDLLWAHKAWQDSALLEAAVRRNNGSSHQAPWPRVLKVDLQPVGVGNRWPSLVTGLLMAALSGRVFMASTDAHFTTYMTLAVDADWGRYSALYNVSAVTACEASFNRLLHPVKEWCKEGEPKDPTIFWCTSNDYDVPVLQINPHLKRQMEQLLPSGNFFHEVTKFLLRPADMVYAALKPYKAYSDQCTIMTTGTVKVNWAISPAPADASARVDRRLLMLCLAFVLCGSLLVLFGATSTMNTVAMCETQNRKGGLIGIARRGVPLALSRHRSNHYNGKLTGLWTTLEGSQTFNASQFANANELLSAHQHWQAHRLEEALQASAAGTSAEPPKAVLYKQLRAGWGNRLPAMVTGMLMAMFTDRVFLMVHENRVTDYLDFHWDVDFNKYTALYSNASTCRVDFNRLTRPGLDFCSGPLSTADIVEYESFDYEVPLLEVNPTLQTTLQRLFPNGRIFHEVATRLFSLSKLVQQAAAQYRPMADECLVGLQIRNRKGSHGISQSNVTAQFASIARAVAAHAPGTMFVAADTKLFHHMAELLSGRTVWWGNESQASIGNLNSAGNPGTDLSAFVDMYLLTRCKHLVCTAASSFGSVAAGYGNIVPVYAVLAQRVSPFSSPVFWKALTSEPSLWKLGHKEQHRLSKENLALLSAHHTYWVQMQQWHT